MSLLAPLYVLGALAVGLPLLFHLIQQRSQREHAFSSLMFLAPTQPRLTRRSRLNDILLFLLRAAAVVLLAVAFARPLIRSFRITEAPPKGQRTVLLVDTSASMQREGLWTKAQAISRQVVEELAPTDRFAILSFDSRVRPVLSFDATAQTSISERTASAHSALQQIRPSWNATDLGQALMTAVDLLHESEGTTESSRLTAGGTIILISDLQRGCQVDSLSGFHWPADVRLDLRRVTPASDANCSLRWVAAQNPTTREVDTETLKVRVTNADDATVDRFQLMWSDLEGNDATPVQESFQVPAGQNRLLKLKQHPHHQRLVLLGDAHPFDNVVFVPRRQAIERELLYLGPDDDGPESPLYFLRRANFDTADRRVRLFVRSDPTEIPSSTLLAIVDQPLLPEQAGRLVEFIAEGGHVLVPLQRESASRSMEGWRTLLQDETLTIEEAPPEEYRMLHRIDFRHPLFQPFADPRFNDFTKIRFWSHRRLSSQRPDDWLVLADFDNHDPALIEKRNGRGCIWLLASSWMPVESQLALSTKFVPLLAGMLELADPVSIAGEYLVGQPILLPRAEQMTTVTRPDGESIAIPPHTETTSFDDTRDPGIYRLRQGDWEDEFAVHLAGSESHTAPLDDAELEQRGVPLSKAITAAERQQHERLERDTELESRQQVWRWLIVVTLLLLGLETFIAGRLANRRPATVSPLG